MRALTALMVVTMLAGCSPAGGTRAPIEPWPYASAQQPDGETIRTGVRIGDEELVFGLLFGGTEAQPAWLGPGGRLTPQSADTAFGWTAEGPGAGPMTWISQVRIADGRLLEYGVTKGPVARIEVAHGGDRTPSQLAPWSRDARIGVFWSVRAGTPTGPETADEDRPVFVAYDQRGAELQRQPLKITGNRGGG